MRISTLRKLARASISQTIYSRAKELRLKLFNNDTDFTNIQIQYLYWVEVYNSMYVDIAMNKPYISYDVIEDDIRTDAYLYWKQVEGKKQAKDSKKTKTMNKGKIKTPSPHIPSLIFRRK